MYSCVPCLAANAPRTKSVMWKQIVALAAYFRWTLYPQARRRSPGESGIRYGPMYFAITNLDHRVLPQGTDKV
ncbi:unnamed protein product [Parascedosporium putredinis]|uniref:Uncharacterized protein n=1 Tax=Parascedosporium putredinis TaxID=1442378 RepID=A0A9P1GUK6_9PEZI|nr:unnamed protein product [Parascedosporium putredinis]CAI7987660.1 unnamed protein product [Parascedosporium putredinis]